MNEELIKEKNFSDSVLSSYRMSLDHKKLQNKMIDNNEHLLKRSKIMKRRIIKVHKNVLTEMIKILSKV
ncbi:hypothetical protein PFMC_04687 [Plasmodium falciparum CAMP/Malaysia]|uniref:Uncharacterized protein n=1 Tax=Plasmodium falciparum (isolate Camp / Malaysia) TaxID=5835 RepID=A0A024X2V2_PLAFC|nr:hypothetical protein PFMC_04687 [Plasmodium falciparum CAMP/Malaysia]